MCCRPASDIAPSHAHRLLQNTSSQRMCSNCPTDKRQPAKERCTNCAADLCLACSAQLHANPVLANHSRSPLDAVASVATAHDVTLSGQVNPPTAAAPTANQDLYDLDLALAASLSMSALCPMERSGFVNKANQCWAIAALLSYWLKPEVRSFFKEYRSVLFAVLHFNWSKHREYKTLRSVQHSGFVLALADIFHFLDNKDQKREGHDPSVFTKSLGFSTKRQHDSGELLDLMHAGVVANLDALASAFQGQLLVRPCILPAVDSTWCKWRIKGSACQRNTCVP